MPDKDKEQTQNLLVAVRVRPLSGVEMQEKGEREVVHVLDNKLVVLRDPNEDQDDILRVNRSRERQYIFDAAFGPNATQEEVYQKTSKPLIKNVITGYNTSVFAYGATGAGKTYTMLGTDKEPGIMGRALNDLFSEMEVTKEDMTYRVSMSYLEIYNEMIKDLLNPSSGVLDLREDSKGAAVVAGISEVEARTTSEVMSMLMMGNKQRTCEPTAANLTSSRSHAILQVTVEQRSRVKNVMQEFRVGKLFMVDLAGSERASQTKNRGKRMIEGAHINRSLLALGNCINALSENRGQYVNYRDSKLTRLLKDSLGGNCLTVMITHVSPSGSSFEETRNTLLYADRAKNIKTKVKQNQFNVSYHITQYTSIIADLRKEVFRLKMKIADHEVEIKSNMMGKSTIPKEDQEEMDRLRNQLVSTFREQMDIRRKLIELEDAAMQIALDTNRHMLTIDQWEQEKARRKARRAADSQAAGAAASGTDTASTVDNESAATNENDHSADKNTDKTRAGKLVKAESVEDVDQKDLDTEKNKTDADDEPDTESLLEPEEVTFAREEISTLIAEEKRMSELKVDLQSKLQQTRQEVEHLEELLPKRISSGENREILGLLCKVHELEITNAELQSQSLLRENLLRHKDLEMYKFESRQRLCDEIIQLQRKVMDDASVSCPSEVEALYDLYKQQMAEIEEREAMLLAREDTQSSLTGSTSSVQARASVLAGLNRRLPAPRDTLLPFSSKLSPLSEESPSRLTSLQNSPVKMSRPTPSSQNLFPEESLDLPPVLPSPKRTSREDTPNSDDYSPTPQNPDSEDQPIKTDFPPTPVFSRTRKIADIAARRRGVLGGDKSVSSSRISLRTEDGVPSKAPSLGPPEEAQSEPSPKLGAKFPRPDASRTVVKASLSMSDLSVIDRKNGDASSEESVPVAMRKPVTRKHRSVAKKAAAVPGRPTRRLRSASLDETKIHKVKPRRTRKEELQELARLKAAESAAAAQQHYYTRNRDRAGLGLEGKGSKRVKRSSIPKPSPVRATDVPRLPGASKVPGLHSGFVSATPDGELRGFISNATPPSTVHQTGVPIGKGQTIQKRYRGASDNLGFNSSQSTPRLKPKRNSLPPTRCVDELSISGVAFRPSKHIRKS